MNKNFTKLLLLGLLMVVAGNAWGDTVNFLTNAGTTIKWGNSTTTLSEGVLTVTPTATDSDMSLDITGSQTITNGQTLVVLETSNNINTNSTRKVRNITVDGNNFDYTSNADWSTKTITRGSETHLLIVFSPINASRTKNETNIFDYFGEHNSMTLTRVGFNFRTTNTEDFKVYRVGFYTVAEIQELYSEANPMRWVVKNDCARFELNGTSNKIDASGSTTPEYTSNRAAVIYKTLGNLPSTITNVNYRYINVTSGSPLKEDVFAGNNASNVLCHATVAQYFPTTKKDLKILGSQYYQYKDGSLDNNYIKDNTTYNYASYTRELIAGYSSCVLPFDVDYDCINAAGLNAYTFSNYENDKLSFTKVTTGCIAANTPFILKAEAAGLYVLSKQLSSTLSTLSEAYKPTEAVNNVKFVGSFKAEQPLASGNAYAGHTCVGISTDGADLKYMTATTKTTYYRAFIDLGTSSTAKALTLSFDDETTGISEIERADVLDGNFGMGQAYNLAGQRVAQGAKGIVIINGKKILNK